ncbi:MAG: SDR family oxidoreductase [Hyphomicrobiaceae bacterium]|nr:SDR family oxidoreductase [Hyphomicrobiaceae bacterium]
MAGKVAVIAGATGAAAKRLKEVLLADASWKVVGLSRNPPRSENPRLTFVAADLTSPESTRAALARVPEVTHVFYTARAQFSDASKGVEDVAGNAAMMQNLIEAAEAAARGLEHVHLVEGTKWYGMHLGRMSSPAREDDPRHMPPNFYYAQEDLLRAAQKGKRWTWSASRPGFLYDFAPERARNLVPTIGVWAAMCRELGTRLDFPGKPANYTALFEATDSTQLARGIVWAATSVKGQNEAFNVTDGTVFRWERLWPRIARLYGLEVGQVRPLNLAVWMADKGPVWEAIAKRHGLASSRMEDVVTWNFGDFLWGLEHDVVSSMTKARLAGFHDTVDTEDQILAHLGRYREARVLV